MTMLKVFMQVVNNAVKLMAPIARPVASIGNVDVKQFGSIVNKDCSILEPCGVGMVGWSPGGPQPGFTIEDRGYGRLGSPNARNEYRICLAPQPKTSAMRIAPLFWNY